MSQALVIPCEWCGADVLIVPPRSVPGESILCPDCWSVYYASDHEHSWSVDLLDLAPPANPEIERDVLGFLLLSEPDDPLRAMLFARLSPLSFWGCDRRLIFASLQAAHNARVRLRTTTALVAWLRRDATWRSLEAGCPGRAAEVLAEIMEGEFFLPVHAAYYVRQLRELEQRRRLVAGACEIIRRCYTLDYPTEGLTGPRAVEVGHGEKLARRWITGLRKMISP